MRGMVARLLTDVFNDLGNLDNAPVMLYLQNVADAERTRCQGAARVTSPSWGRRPTMARSGATSARPSLWPLRSVRLAESALSAVYAGGKRKALRCACRPLFFDLSNALTHLGAYDTGLDGVASSRLLLPGAVTRARHARACSCRAGANWLQRYYMLWVSDPP